jgi:hypothetical protein
MSIFEFASGFEDGVNQAERTIQLSNALMDIPPEERQKSSVLGAGLTIVMTAREMLQSLNITISVDVKRQEGIGPGQIVNLPELDNLYGFVQESMRSSPEWLRRVKVAGMFEPELHLQPGDRVQGTLGGSAGCSLSWDNGNGFAMAGHVAPIVGQTITQYGANVGTVVWANNPTGRGTSIEADFCVVELSQNIHFNGTQNRYSHGRPYDLIAVANQNSNRPRSMIIGMFPEMALPSHNSRLGDIYLTGSVISSAGDSGAPAINPNGEVYGHIIGAVPGMSSLVQDLTYQINFAAAVLPGLRM